MSSILQDYQFQLISADDDLPDIVFGQGCPVFVDMTAGGFDPGAPNFRTNDSSLANRDGISFGRDQIDGGLMTWSLCTQADDPLQALDDMSQLAGTWFDARLRNKPEAFGIMRYRIAGRPGPRRVYGRPRNFGYAAPGPEFYSGAVKAVAQFQRSLDVSFSDTLHSTTLLMSPPQTSVGFTLPTTLPVTTGVLTVPRQGVMTNLGNTTTPVKVTITAGNTPLTNPTVEGEDWKFTLYMTIPAGGSVVIDTAPWAQYVTRSGKSVRGAFVSDTDFDSMGLPPGVHEFQFYGYDPSGLASCRIQWRDSFTGL